MVGQIFRNPVVAYLWSNVCCCMRAQSINLSWNGFGGAAAGENNVFWLMFRAAAAAIAVIACGAMEKGGAEAKYNLF